MVKRYKIGKSHVTFLGGTIDEIEEKKAKYEKANCILQEAGKPEEPVKRKRRTKAEIEADALAKNAMADKGEVY